MDRLPYSAAPSGERTTIVWGMASTIPRASCSDNDAVAVKVLISLFSVPAGWTRVLDIRGGAVTGHSAGFRAVTSGKRRGRGGRGPPAAATGSRWGEASGRVPPRGGRLALLLTGHAARSIAAV